MQPGSFRRVCKIFQILNPSFKHLHRIFVIVYVLGRIFHFLGEPQDFFSWKGEVALIDYLVYATFSGMHVQYVLAYRKLPHWWQIIVTARETFQNAFWNLLTSIERKESCHLIGSITQKNKSLTDCKASHLPLTQSYFEVFLPSVKKQLATG